MIDYNYRLVKKPKKTKEIRIFVSDNEYETLYELGKALNLSVSEVVYKKALNYSLRPKTNDYTK